MTGKAATTRAGPGAIADALDRAGVRFVVNLPETWMVPLLEEISDRPAFVEIPVTREDEGVGVCAGIELGGGRSALLMQNTGLLASVNAITGLALRHRIPLLMLVSHRGAPGRAEEADYTLLTGELTAPVLDALRIPVYPVDEPGDAPCIADARERATRAAGPVAVLLGREALLG